MWTVSKVDFLHYEILMLRVRIRISVLCAWRLENKLMGNTYFFLALVVVRSCKFCLFESHNSGRESSRSTRVNSTPPAEGDLECARSLQLCFVDVVVVSLA